MIASKDDIRRWLDAGLLRSHQPTHMLVVCDTFDYSDYPVYVDKDVDSVIEKYHGKNMQKVMEVYAYSRPIDSQLDEFRAWHND